MPDVHVWQSQIEIKYYSIVYFERITEFVTLFTEVPLRVGLIHDV